MSQIIPACLPFFKLIVSLGVFHVWGEIRACRQRALKRLLIMGVAPRAPQTWRDESALIAEKEARPYDEAVALLLKLRDLAVFQNELPEP